MFKEIFKFELQYGFNKAATYIFWGLLFAFTLMIGLSVAGVFNVTRSDSNILFNSAYSVANILLGTTSSIFGLLVNILLISVISTAIQKDYEYNTHPMFFTKPISKPGYFFGRFLGAFVVAVFVFSGLVLGFMVGSLFGLGKPFMGPFNLLNFLQPFVVFTIPSVALFGILFFSLVTYTRSTMPAYLAAIILFVLQIVAGSITANIDNKTLAALLEPTGSQAFRTLTEYWTPADKNTGFVPLSGVLLHNRLIWLAVALVICLVSYKMFSFSQFQKPFSLFKNKAALAPSRPQTHSTLTELPKVQQIFSSSAERNQVWYLAKYEFFKMIKTPFFFIMCLLGIGMMVVSLVFMGRIYDANTFPVTYSVVDVAGVFGLFITIFIVFYSGTLVWKDRETKMDELVGVTPVQNSTLFLSKNIALILASAILLVVAVFTGVGYQVAKGFFNLQLSQYAVFFLVGLLSAALVSFLCTAVQAYSPNKYLGFFYALIPIMVLPIIFGLLQWNSDLIQFDSSGPGRPYSDMNGYGQSYLAAPFFKLYWLGFVGILGVLATMLYARGKEKSLKARWNLSANNGNKFMVPLLGFAVLMLASGLFIAYQQFYLQDHTKAKTIEKETAAFEKKYKYFQSYPQPRIVASDIQVDIFASKNSMKSAGVYWLKNISQKPIDTLIVNYFAGRKPTFHYTKLAPIVGYKLLRNDSLNGIRMFQLNQSLLPGDSIQFAFDFEMKPNGLFDRINSPVVENGTFINNMYFPSIGYNEASELSENRARKEYGLPEKPRMAAVDDSVARMNNYISKDADWIQFKTTVSTDEGQIAIAPGYLQKDWKQNGRHYFSYKMDSPILNFYSYLSANYQVKKDKWNNVDIEIYYQKGHEYNLDRMIDAIKKSLDYYTVNFGPYQHRQVRIIEFPRYASFAQSFPNTIPFSESIGFITKVLDGPDDIDVPFYVTAHEVAHQWWAHQVIGGDVQGSVLFSESMSQYSALMVMEKTYGKDAMKKFLKYEMDKYLQGRTFEGKKEVPLMLCENQAYIHYNKGSVVMYALKDYIGEEKLNGAIRSFLNKWKFKGPIYPNAIDFVAHLKQATPDSLQYFVSDMFEKITIYENYAKASSYTKLADGKFKVTMTVGCAKFYSDELGKETRAMQINDYVDVGIFSKKKLANGADAPPLLMQRVKMDKQEKTFEFVVDEEPASAGIDPYLKLVDKNPKNNILKMGETAAKVNLEPGAKAAINIKF